MQMSRSTHAFAFFLAGFSFLLSSASPGQDTGVGVNPTLRQLETEKRQAERETGPNYVIVDLPYKRLLQYYPELKDLAPATSQDDLTTLLTKVGANEDSFLLSLPNLSSQEDVTLEKLDKHGWVQGSPTFTGNYRYLLRGQTVGENLRFSEGRTDQNFRQIEPPAPNGLTLAQGFALLPLQFHPFHQIAAKFRYLGRQVVDNRQDYVVAFAQEAERTQLSGVVTVNGRNVPVAYQGIAWIEPDNFQILRMRVDLLKPRPEIGWQKTDIQLSEVRLPVVTKPLWLPHDAVVTTPTKNGALREKHEFSDYRVFVTSTTVPSTSSSTEKPK